MDSINTLSFLAFPDSYAETRAVWEGLPCDVIMHAAHSFNGLNFSKRENKSRNAELAHEAYRFADRLQSEFVIFHPGIGGELAESVMQMHSQKDPRMLIENNPELSLDGQFCIGWNLRSLRRIIKETKIGFCLDFGHAICAANSSGSEKDDFLKELYLLEPAMYHLTDGDIHQQRDNHLRYGSGSFPLQEYVDMMPDGARVTNEATRKENEGLAEVIEDAIAFRKLAGEVGMKQACLVSGALGEHVLLYLLNSSMHYQPSAVFTNTASKEIIKLCEEKGIDIFIGNPRKGRARDFLKSHPVEIVISVNYLFIVEDDLLKWPSKYAINFHGSLLPKYRGRTPHVWSIINNESKCGVTAHIMEKECDAGDIVMQREVNIDYHDTGAMLLEKYKALYPEMVIEVLDKVVSGTVTRIPQDEERATFFGERTPQYGMIDWCWQKERIRNWVRAQARPYPGAFTFFQDVQVIIDKIQYSDMGFSYLDPNGMIKVEADGQVHVKTPNGMIQLVTYEIKGNVNKQAMNGSVFSTRK